MFHKRPEHSAILDVVDDVAVCAAAQEQARFTYLFPKQLWSVAERDLIQGLLYSQEKDKVIDYVEGTLLDEHFNGKHNPIAVEVAADFLTPTSTAHAPATLGRAVP